MNRVPYFNSFTTLGQQCPQGVENGIDANAKRTVSPVTGLESGSHALAPWGHGPKASENPGDTAETPVNPSQEVLS